MSLAAAGNTGATTSVSKVSGDGGFTVSFPVGLAAVVLEPVPVQGTQLDWALQVGIAPQVANFAPADNAILKMAPATISVHAHAPGQMVLDRKAVDSTYNATSGLVSYTPRQPLAVGLHIVEVMGTDGTLATSHATFFVMPTLSENPAGTSSGKLDGTSWISTNTPDGRYSLDVPSNWEMAARDGTVLLCSPKGDASVQVSERMLGDPVDASTVAHGIAAKLPGTSRFQSIARGAMFSTSLKGKSGGRALFAVVVLPSLAKHTLLIALGLSGAAQPLLGDQVEHVLASFRANDDAGVVNARAWLNYQRANFDFVYPAGWMGDFTSTDMALLVGPFDGAYLVGISSEYGGSASATQMAAAGRSYTTWPHPSVQVQAENSGPGIYRWIGTYAGSDRSLCVELGQVIASHGQLQAFFADTSAELAPTNVPVLARSLDSAANGLGVAAPLQFTTAAAVQGMSTGSAAASTLQGKGVTGSSGGANGSTSSNGYGSSSIGEWGVEM
jgi:hypothetical protein